MLQQTRMEVVLPFFERFVERFPTLGDLASATDDQVTAAWSGLGYYRRARMLRDAASVVLASFGGRIPDDVAVLRGLPGVGRYTAGAIASVAWNRRVPIVDGNIARVLSRLFAIELRLGTAAHERTAWELAETLVGVCDQPRDLNQALMEIGALLCTPRKPSCLLCPLNGQCAARASGRQEGLPWAKAKKEPVAMTVALFVIVDAAGRILMRRSQGPLLNGMLYLPADGSLFDNDPFPAVRRQHLGRFRHTITTRRIAFDVWKADPPARIADRPDSSIWIHPEELHSQPHPSWVRKALRIAAASRDRVGSA